MKKIEFKVDGKPFARVDLEKGRVKIGRLTYPLQEAALPGFEATEGVLETLGDEILAHRLHRVIARLAELHSEQ